MSNEIQKKDSRWGGPRPNSGPKKGSGTHTKICISVDKIIWQDALSRWKKKQSHLVNELLTKFVDGEVKI